MVEVRGRTLHRGSYLTRQFQGGFVGVQSHFSGREYSWNLAIVVVVFGGFSVQVALLYTVSAAYEVGEPGKCLITF